MNHLRIHARPDRRHENDCPFCHKRCRPYDVQTRSSRIWRALDWSGTLVEIQYRTHRIHCPEHGVLVADVPWAYPGSGFTKDFDLTVGWLAVYLPRSTVSEYIMKEILCLLLKLKDVKEAEAELNRWLWWASHSRIPAFRELYRKLRRHKGHILNTIRLGMSNARTEATNNKIKLIIRKAYGFRNIQNMLDIVYLVCSDLRISLPN